MMIITITIIKLICKVTTNGKITILKLQYKTVKIKYTWELD